METPGNLLFELLASGGTVVLPSVGTLRVERTDAAFDRNAGISAPVNRVVFHRKEFQSPETMAGLIARMNGTDLSEAERMYYEWIDNSRQPDGSLLLEPSGRLADGAFTPSEQLEARLNPGTLQPAIAAESRSGRARRRLLIVAAAALTVGAVWYMWESDDILGRRAEKKLYGQPSHASRTERTETEKREFADSEIPEADAAAGVQATPNAAVQPAATPAATPASGRYILVAGVYSTEENADRFISEDALGIGRARYFKRPFGSGKIMVGIMAADDRDETARYKRSFGPGGYELWIYDTRK